MTIYSDWAVRVAKRIAKVAGALLLFSAAVVIAYFLLPVEPTRYSINIQFEGEVRARGELLGKGRVTIDDATLRRLAMRAPGDATPVQVGSMLRPNGEFTGTFGPGLLENTGLNVFLVEGDVTYVFRLLCYADGDDLLILPLTFDLDGACITDWKRARQSEVIEFAWPPARRRFVEHELALSARPPQPSRNLR